MFGYYVGSLDQFSTIQFAMFARGLYKAIQMMDSNFFVLEKGNQYLSAGIFLKLSDVDLWGREILF